VLGGGPSLVAVVVVVGRIEHGELVSSATANVNECNRLFTSTILLRMEYTRPVCGFPKLAEPPPDEAAFSSHLLSTRVPELQ
jgi:hypothetical protein